MIDLSIPDPSLGPAGEPVPPFQGGTVKDAAAFRGRMEAWKLHVLEQHAALTKRVSAEVLSGLVLGNPVGNPSRWKHPRKGYVGGHSRRNWQISVGGEPTELPGVDPAGTVAMAAGYAAIAALQPGQSVIIANPVPYAERLAQGWSPQAPAGWVDEVFARVWDKYTRAK